MFLKDHNGLSATFNLNLLMQENKENKENKEKYNHILTCLLVRKDKKRK